MLGSFFAFKFRHILEMFLTEDYKKIQLQPDMDYIQDNEAPIIQSLKNLYEMNPRLILYKVIYKKNYLP